MEYKISRTYADICNEIGQYLSFVRLRSSDIFICMNFWKLRALPARNVRSPAWDSAEQTFLAGSTQAQNMKYQIFVLTYDLAHLYLGYHGLTGDSHLPEFYDWNDLVVAKTW